MAQFLRLIRKPFVAALFGGLLVFLCTLTLRATGNLEHLELSAYDWFIRMEPKLPTANPRITLIEISESDIRAYGRWPLTDETLARALKILLKDNPRVIGLDIYRDIPVGPGRRELNNIFSEHPNIIGVMTFDKNGVPPLGIISNTAQVGFSDILVDPGGIVRRGILFLDDGKNVFYSFALRLALLYLQPEGITPRADPKYPQYVRLKDTTIRPFETNDGGYTHADARGYQFLLDFEDAGSPFRSYSFMSLMSGDILSEAIKDKIVIIGVSALSVKDFFYTPLSLDYVEDQQTSGIVLHGYITSQLLRYALDGTKPITSPADEQKAVWILFWSLAGGLIGFRTRSAFRFSVLSAGGLVILFLSAYLAFLARWWIPLVPPALSFFVSAATVTAYITNQEKKERALLMQIFSRHVSKEIAETIWQQREQFLNNGRPRSQKLTVTALFSDLRGFTSVAEKMDPQDLMDWLNTYMESMARLIMTHDGVIDNYTGDGIKADFGVPLPRKDEDEIRKDAVNAVKCALAMEREMEHLNALWSSKGLPAVGMRIGIFTGPAVAGLLGSSQRMKYTTVGDSINVASRLEGFEKEVGKETRCRILIGESTRRYLGNHFKTERIGEVSLKGKDEKITIHRVLGEELPDDHLTSEVSL